MKLVLLIAIMFTLSLVHGVNHPCQENNDNNKYNVFLQNHIVQDIFERSLMTEWETYINSGGRCRGGTQSFLERSDLASINNICNGEGHPLKNQQSDLCISDSTFRVYDLVVVKTNNCKVTSMNNDIKKVIVGCNVIANQCVPVHFHTYVNQEPDNAQVCKP